MLEDDQKRKQYDSFGHAGVDPNYQSSQQQYSGNPFAGFGGFGGGGFRVRTNGGAINLEDLFDMMDGRGQNGGPGEDIQSPLRLTFMEAVNGCTKDISFEYFIREPVSPGTRGGRNGFQKIRKNKKVTVNIPAGVQTGINMRVSGEGAEGSKGYAPGDLYVILEVAEVFVTSISVFISNYT